MNNVQLIGRLTKDPESSQGNGHDVARLRLAVNARDRKSTPDYVDVVCFDGLAKSCADYLEKGRQVAISGRLSHSEWEADDGSKRSRLQVIAREVEFLAAAKREDSDD